MRKIHYLITDFIVQMPLKVCSAFLLFRYSVWLYCKLMFCLFEGQNLHRDLKSVRKNLLHYVQLLSESDCC